MGDPKLYCGIDVGASATKVVLINSDLEIVGHEIRPTGSEGAKVADECLVALLAELGAGPVMRKVATGYARDSVKGTDFTRTEISSHSKGCLHYFSGPITIVDIGGQDNKIIIIDADGKRTGFKFNRKCAAGTGAFLEEIALILDLSVWDLNELAEKAESPVKLGSFCTVFAKTEILTNFKQGDRMPDIVAGAFESVVKRVIEMDPLEGNIVATGGVVAHNPEIVRIFESKLGRAIKVPPHPQLAGAFGAALFALEGDS